MRAISYEPRGNGRDVLWCSVVGEPVFLRFVSLEDARAQCELCGWADLAANERDAAVYPDAFANSHPFICHIGRPT